MQLYQTSPGGSVDEVADASSLIDSATSLALFGSSDVVVAGATEMV